MKCKKKLGGEKKIDICGDKQNQIKISRGEVKEESTNKQKNKNK